MALMVKNPLDTAGDIRDLGSVPGLGRSPGEGNGNPHQYSCQENPVDGGAWRTTVYEVTKSQTQPKQLSIAKHSMCIKSSLQTIVCSVTHSFFLF